MTFERMWHDLAPVGRSASSGGYFRQPFGTAERETHAWFLEECARRDLRAQSDGNGNTIAWWLPSPGIVPNASTGSEPKNVQKRLGVSVEDGVMTGSHLDSVLDG